MELPEDLVVNILQRLLAMCYFRFRCVCKAWYSLLSDPFFMYKSLACIDSDHLRVLVKEYCFSKHHNDFSVISFDGTNDHCRSPLAIPGMKDWSRPLSIVGAYNGLVCLTDHDSVISVWNTLTQETRVLPNTDHDSLHKLDELFFDVGFCFDAGSHDYKVIKLFHRKSYTPHRYVGKTNTAYLYSFLRGCWKKLDFSLGLGIILAELMVRTPTNLSEKCYHWIVDPGIDIFEYRKDFSYVVLSFDADLELFKTTEIPYTLNYSKQVVRQIEFFMLKEYVAISAPLRGGPPIYEIPVLVKAGVKESWTKLITVGPIIDGKRILNTWSNGKLFVQTSKEVKVFDPFTGEEVKLFSATNSIFSLQLMALKRGWDRIVYSH